MATQHVRISSQKILSYCPHTDVSGESWVCSGYGTATSAGAADGTTLIDTNADSGGADTYSGRYWVRITSGANKDQWKRIVDDDGSGTLTFENNGFPNQVASGVEYEIWFSPDPVVVVDSSSGETNMVDAVRADEANDFWIGYYAVPITGTHRGKIAQITDFVKSTGTFTLAASFGSALSAGDVVLLRRFIEVSDEAPGLTREYIEARQNRVNLRMGDGLVSVRGGTFSFNTDIHGSGALADSGNAPGVPPIGGLLPACGLPETSRDLVFSTTIDAGSDSTNIELQSGSWDSHIIGSPVVYNGHMRFVTALADGGVGTDTVTVTPALPVDPTSGETLHAGRMYETSEDGDVLGCVLEYTVDGERLTMTGCKGNVAFSPAGKVQLAFSFNVDHWIREIEAPPYTPNSAYPTQAPIKSDDMKAWINATGVDIMEWTASANTETGVRAVSGSTGVNGRQGYQVVGYAPGMTFQELLSSSGDLDQDERFGARTSLDIILVFGSHGNCFGIRIPAGRLIADPLTADSDGLRAAPSVIGAHDAGTWTDPTPTTGLVPIFAIGIV